MEILNSPQQLSNFFPSASSWNFESSPKRNNLTTRKGIKRKYCDGEFIEEERPQKQFKSSKKLFQEFPNLQESYFSSSPSNPINNSNIRLSGRKRSSACLEPPTDREYVVEIPLSQKPRYQIPKSDSKLKEDQIFDENVEKSLIPVFSSISVEPKVLENSREIILSCWNNSPYPIPPRSEFKQLIPYQGIPKPLFPNKTQDYDADGEDSHLSSSNRVVEITEEEAVELLKSQKASACHKKGYLLDEEEQSKDESSAMELD